MKNTIKLLAAALLLTLTGCHEPEELTPSVETLGLNSVSAQFATGDYKKDAQAKFTTSATSADQERFVIEIPYYYPESSENLVEITQMRVSANLDDNCFITPSLGTLDLTQEHWFTLTRGDGSKRQICITGTIKKSNKCDIEAFSLPNLGLTGIIDQAKQEISIVPKTDAPLKPALAKYQLSYHATISPDPAVKEFDYNDENGVQLTVTAHDGETQKTYTVKKNVLEKVESGIRKGSQHNIFKSENFKEQWGMTGTLNYTIGVMGDYLLVCSGADELVYVNKLNGAYVGKVDMNGVNLQNGTNGGGAICSDDADHLVMCTNTTNGGTLHVYMLDDVEGTPQEKVTWTNNTGSRMGAHISVRGDISDKAVITINAWSGGTRFIRILVEDGVWQEPELVVITGCGSWGTGNVDVEYLTTDITGPYFKVNYSTNSLEWIDGATNARVAVIGPGAADNGNSNCNNVSCCYFNGKPYVALYSNAHFTNSSTRALLFDASSQSDFTGTFDDSPAKYYGSTPIQFWGAIDGTTASGDVLLTSPDGYHLYWYWISGNARFIRAEEFDCLKQ